jgi:radical SAM superfamily enzyme YgiQ (UPF0313 family)
MYGNAERQIVEVAHRLASGENIKAIQDIRGTAFLTKNLLPDFREVDATQPDVSERENYLKK